MFKSCSRSRAAVGLGAIFLLVAIRCLAASGAVAPAGNDLSGYWKLNTALSDDPEKLLQQRIEEDRKLRERWMRREQERGGDALGIPPVGMPSPTDAPAPDTSVAPAAEPRKRPRNRRLEELRRMLDISDTLSIKQAGARVEIVSQLNSGSFDAGTKSQISMPQGELADQRVGWEGTSFIIERRASRGPKMTQRYRLLKKTDQLESTLSWGGDSPLDGIKVRRVFDRMVAPPPPPDPDSGPVK